MEGFPIIVVENKDKTIMDAQQTSYEAAGLSQPPEQPVSSTVLYPLPDTLKSDNWQLYVLARSNDPSVQVPNTRKLLSNLVNSAKIMYGVRDIGKIPDPILVKDLIRSIAIVNDAWYEYSEEHNWGYAAAECEKVLDKLGDLLYNPKWSTGKRDSFLSSGGPLPKK